MNPTALRYRLSRVADMVDALGRMPVGDLQVAIDALRMEVHRAERDCAEPALGFTAFDVARQKGEPIAADPTLHASTSPGPVNCNAVLQAQGKSYPRTCARCGLWPCPFFDKDGNSLRQGGAL